MDFSWFDYGAMTIAACACSWVNAIAGGGILILYPLLVVLGMPPLVANVSIKIGLYPGSVSAMVAVRDLLKDQWHQAKLAIIPSFLGALVGSVVVAFAGEKSFTYIVPWCIVIFSALMAFSKQIKAYLFKTFTEFRQKADHPLLMAFTNILTGFYSAYFGAGNGFIFYSLLSIFYNRDVKSINALRQVNVTASHTASFFFFAFTIFVNWKVAGFIFLGSIVGGYLGGLTSKRIPAKALKIGVVAFGFVFGIYLLLKTYGILPPL